MPINPISKFDLDLMAQAVKEWAAWRGSITGNPDPSALKKFDARIQLASRALVRLRCTKAQIDNFYTEPDK